MPYDSSGNWHDEDLEVGSDGNEVDPSSPAKVLDSDPIAPNRSDPAHVYVGRDGRGDVWQLVDAGGNVIEWATVAGAPSGNVIPGSVANLGAPSSMSVAQGPTAPAAATPAPGDPSHKYVGSQNGNDIWQMVDGAGRTIQWAVRINDDSRNMLPNSASVTQPAGSSAPNYTAAGVVTMQPVNVTPGTPGGGPATTPTASPVHKYQGSDGKNDFYSLVDEGGKMISWAVPIGADSRAVTPGTLRQGLPVSIKQTYTTPGPDSGMGIPGSVEINNGPGPYTGTAGPPKQSNPLHVYVGRDSRGDVWQLIDEGGIVIEWAVAAGDESSNAIAGSARSLGPPSSMTVAKLGKTVVTTPAPILTPRPAQTTSPAATEKSGALVWIGIAASVLGALK
jgi:hypothetical protein